MDRLRAIRPRKLYITADGPRPDHPTDAERCADVRKIVLDIDWPSAVQTRFHERNVGCKMAVGGGIGWLFEHEESGIILEDDIVADSSFFPFCTDLLERYRDDERIGIISGCNSTSGRIRPAESYFFLRNLHMLGWATWRRVWQLVDLDMSDWNDSRSAAFISSLYGASWATRQVWERHFDNTVNRHRTDVWDYQVCYALWRHGMFSVAPRVNLIDNDGFGVGATHPEVGKPNWMLRSSLQSITFPLRHPTEVRMQTEADTIIDRDVFGISLGKSLRIAAKMQLRKLRYAVTGRYA